MVSKHCTDNDPINKNLRLEKKFQIFLALHAALQNKQTKKSGYLERQHCNPSGAVPSLSVPTKPTHPAKIGWKDDFVILIWILLKSESRLFTFVPSMCHSQGPSNKCLVYMLRLSKYLVPPYCMCGLSRNARNLQTANITQAHIHKACKLKSQHTKKCI